MTVPVRLPHALCFKPSIASGRAPAANLERINELLLNVPVERRGSLRSVDLFVMRPSEDLAAIAQEYEFELPAPLKYLTRGWETRETQGADSLAMLLFESGYTRRLVELGARDGRASLSRIEAFLGTP